jgi:hypothetical protein
MAYYCEDCRHKVCSIASAKGHRRFGHTVTLLEPSPPARGTREAIPVELIGEFHFHHEMPFANLVQCTGSHPNLPPRAPRQVTVYRSPGRSRTTRSLCERCLTPLPYNYRLRFCLRCRRETIEAYVVHEANG